MGSKPACREVHVGEPFWFWCGASDRKHKFPPPTPLWTFCRGGDDTISAARSTSATGLAVAPRLREASARLNETDALLAAAVVAAETAGAGPGVGQLCCC